MTTLPEDIANRALDAIGSDIVVGSIGSDGTRASEVVRRSYTPTLQQLLRTAHWNFARKRGKLQLLADASGQTLAPLTNLPISNRVEPPWRFAYAWPNDGLQARWLPWNQDETSSGSSTGAFPPGNVSVAVPAFEENGSWCAAQAPARFMVSSSDAFPVVVGQTGWQYLPDFAATQGLGPINRRIILTNQCNAWLVYTRVVSVPDEWDPLFSQAMVAVLGSVLANARGVLDDRKEAMTMRAQQIAIARDAIQQARVANGNDAGMPQSVSHIPDWIRARSVGYGARAGAGGSLYGEDGPGVWGYGWGGFAFADGSVY